MNYGSLAASGIVKISSNKTNLWNEGPIGYASLFGVGFCCFMFAKEFLTYIKTLRSLNTSDTHLREVKKNFV